MDKQKLDILFAAVISLLRPLVRILLRNGVPFGTFAELARWVYVDTAAEEFSIEGRKQSDSRISVLTGLSRKAVASLRSIDAPPADAGADRYNRAARVISGWLRDSRFCDPQGNPRRLPLEGEASFSELVHDHSGDIPARAILDELINVGAVEPDPAGSVRLLTRAYIPGTDESEKLRILGSDVSDLIRTIDRNLKGEPPAPLFQRKVSYDNLPQEAVEAFRTLGARKAQGLLEEMDRWLARHDRDSNPEAKGSGRMRSGFGIYYFDENLDEDPGQVRGKGARS